MSKALSVSYDAPWLKVDKNPHNEVQEYPIYSSLHSSDSRENQNRSNDTAPDGYVKQGFVLQQGGHDNASN